MSENICPCGDELTEERPICPDCFPLAADQLGKYRKSLEIIATWEPEYDDFNGLDAAYMNIEAQEALGMED